MLKKQEKKVPKKIQTKQNLENKEEKYEKKKSTLSKEIRVNLSNIQSTLGRSYDIIFKEFSFSHKEKIEAFVCFVDGWIDKDFMNEFILKPLVVDLHIIDQGKKFVMW